MNNSTWNNVTNILCIRLDNMGDVILTSPAIAALRQKFPFAKITLLTSSQASAITPFLPVIDETLTYDAPWMKFQSLNTDTLELITLLKEKKFDAGICFSNFSQNCFPEAFLLFLADIPLRLGYARENPHNLLTDWVPDQEPFQRIYHGIQRQMNLLRHIGVDIRDTMLQLTIKNDDMRNVKKILKENGINSNKPFVVVHPGASDPIRRFSPQTLGAAIQEISKTRQVVITGVKEEKLLAKELKAYAPTAISLCDQLTLGQFIALISLSTLLLCNNSGPVHIAASVGTPVVVLYARTNPEHTPWKVPHKVLYFDVDKRFISMNQILQAVKPKNQIKNITKHDIVAAVKNLLQETSQKNSYA